MNMMLILLKKEFIILKNKYVKLFLFSILFPLFLYLFLSIPLSLVFENIKPIYLIWSSTGVHIVSTLILLFVVLVPILHEKFESEFLFSTPVSFANIIFSIYIFALILSLVQFMVSTLLINFLNNHFSNVVDFILMFLIFIPSIIVICNVAIILSCLLKDMSTISIVNILLFIFILYGLGSFFPIKFYPEPYYSIFSYFPISCSIINIQKILAAENIYFSHIIVSLLYMLFFASVGVFVMHHKIKDRLY